MGSMTEPVADDAVDTPGPSDPADEPAVPGPGGRNGAGTGDGGDGGGDDADEYWGSGLSWARALVLAGAVGFLGLAIGLFVSRDRQPADDSVDVGFARDMVTHHEQALGLASLELVHGENPTVRSFASEVLTFQSYEIGVMQQTLRTWGYPGDDRPDEAMAWMDMAAVPYRQMPGMLSDDQLDEMGDARGADADALFLELMAEHHLGGLHMAVYAATEVTDDELRDLAALMAHNQALEINEYRATAAREGFDVAIEPVEVPPAP
jgi:uncharacterized protein (DUF305 family)